MTNKMALGYMSGANDIAICLVKQGFNKHLNPGNTGDEYFIHICGSLLNFKKSHSSHLNISRSIVPQMFMTISIKKI